MRPLLTLTLTGLLAMPAAAEKHLKGALPPAMRGPGAGGGSGPAPMDMMEPAEIEPSGRNVKLSFKIRNGILESSGNFVLESGTQSNYVVGGERPRETEHKTGTEVEFKKYGTIVNALVAFDQPGSLAGVQLQIELSGPQEPMGTLKVPPIETFQYQTSFVARLGKPVVLVDEPARRVEVLVEDVTPQ